MWGRLAGGEVDVRVGGGVGGLTPCGVDWRVGWGHSGG
jgi:hypothetical protein